MVTGRELGKEQVKEVGGFLCDEEGFEVAAWPRAADGDVAKPGRGGLKLEVGLGTPAGITIMSRSINQSQLTPVF